MVIVFGLCIYMFVYVYRHVFNYNRMLKLFLLSLDPGWDTYSTNYTGINSTI